MPSTLQVIQSPDITADNGAYDSLQQPFLHITGSRAFFAALATAMDHVVDLNGGHDYFDRVVRSLNRAFGDYCLFTLCEMEEGDV